MPTDPHDRDCDLTFVIETLNLRDAHDYTPLDTALRAISRQTHPADRLQTIVVVDPAAEPGLSAWCAAAWPGVAVLEVPAGTHYYAMKNAGARAARGRIVGYVDADCQPAPEWAASMLEALSGDDGTVAFAVGVYDTPRSSASWLAKAFLMSIFANQVGIATRPTSSIAASNCAVRRDRIVARPFREDPFFHGPDVEMSTRVSADGERMVLVAGARNIHDHEPGFGAQHGRGVYWGYCFLRLRLDGSPDVPYARLFRRLGPLAPLAVLPAKAAIDLRNLIRRRQDLAASVPDTIAVAGLLVMNAFSASLGAMRYAAGLPPPRQPQVTRFSTEAPARPETGPNAGSAAAP